MLRYFLSFFRVIDENEAIKHLDEPEWFNANYDIFIRNNPSKYHFVDKYIMSRSNTEILDVLYNKGFIFSNLAASNPYRTPLNVTPEYNTSLNCFKWLIDKKLIAKNASLGFELCDWLLACPDRELFEKFKYAFESHYPISRILTIENCDLILAEDIYQYLSLYSYITVNYTVDFLNVCLLFLENFLIWLRSHGLYDNYLKESWIDISNKFGIEGIELLMKYGYIDNILLYSDKCSQETKNYLLSKGITLKKYTSSGKYVKPKNIYPSETNEKLTINPIKQNKHVTFIDDK